jgi:hypothetical protein
MIRCPEPGASMSDKLKEIENSGEWLLSKTAQCVPRFRIMRDILKLAPDHADFIEAKAELLKSKWVIELQDYQHADGTWGRFHSRDSTIRAKYPTTELAISRALALGLDRDSLLLRRSVYFMLDQLAGRRRWSDPAEKHEGWPVNTRFITAATLARIDQQHPALQESSQVWVEIVERTFRSGAYNEDDERKAQYEINGIHTRHKYLKLAALYPLLLLMAAKNGLSEKTQKMFLDWVWNKRGGIYYVYGGRLSRVPKIDSREFSAWLEALEILSGFSSWRFLAHEAVEWIWKQVDQEGFWDFGAAARASIYFPLSENWRHPIDRKIDCSLRILALMRKSTEA